MNSPTDVLREEHRVILRALAVLESAADRRPADGRVPDGWWERAVAWLREFADASHHAKEERALFPALVKAGVPAEGGPVAVMLAEHVAGRELIRAMADGPDARRTAAARQYVSLLRQHIDKENDVLFPQAEQALPADELEGLGQAFADFELQVIGPGRHEELHDLLHRWKAAYAG